MPVSQRRLFQRAQVHQSSQFARRLHGLQRSRRQTDGLGRLSVPNFSQSDSGRYRPEAFPEEAGSTYDPRSCSCSRRSGNARTDPASDQAQANSFGLFHGQTRWRNRPAREPQVAEIQARHDDSGNIAERRWRRYRQTWNPRSPNDGLSWLLRCRDGESDQRVETPSKRVC